MRLVDYSSKSKIFLVVCLVFIAGIALASFLPVKTFYFSLELFGAGIFFLILIVLFWRFSRETGISLVCLFFLLAAVLSFSLWRYGLSLPEDGPDRIWHYNGQTVTGQGFISNEPDIRDDNQKLEITVDKLSENSIFVILNGAKRSEESLILASFSELDSSLSAQNDNSLTIWSRSDSGKILITADLYPAYKYGDRLEFSCALKRPEEYQGFAYDRYLSRFNIYSVCYYPRLKIIPGSGGNYVYAAIFSFKAKLTGLIDSGLSEPAASLARPIVFGGQRGLEQAIRDDFQKTGLTHIMAVSGFNVSILAAIVMVALLALGLSRRQAFYLAVIFLAVYIILVGLPASARRAGLMGFLVLWALKLGRLNKITNSLVLTAAVLLLINPKLLRDDAGFQLSFLALAGLIYVYPILEAVWQKIKLPKFKGLSDALLITLAAQIFTLPVLAYNFSQISLIAPLANLAVLWAVPILTILILAALPLSALLPGLSFLFFLPSLILTKYILLAVKYLAKLPYSYLEVSYLSWIWPAIYYLAVIYAIMKLRRTKLLKNELNAGQIL